MLRVIMGVSEDGFVSKGDNDDMAWLGPDDKAVFRILTGVGGMLFAGSKTIECMPSTLQGRVLAGLSTRYVEMNLRGHKGVRWTDLGAAFQYSQGDGKNSCWLLGGQTVVQQAVQHRYVSEVHLCVGRGIRIRRGVELDRSWLKPFDKTMSTTIGDVQVLRFTPLDVQRHTHYRT